MIVKSDTRGPQATELPLQYAYRIQFHVIASYPTSPHRKPRGIDAKSATDPEHST